MQNLGPYSRRQLDDPDYEPPTEQEDHDGEDMVCEYEHHENYPGPLDGGNYGTQNYI